MPTQLYAPDLMAFSASVMGSLPDGGPLFSRLLTGWDLGAPPYHPVGTAARGYDGDKPAPGRKRHPLINTDGRMLKAGVCSAVSMGGDGGKWLLTSTIRIEFPRLWHVWLDAG